MPWVCLALGALELLEDPQTLAALEQLQARGVPVRVSRESQLFALEPPASRSWRIPNGCAWPGGER